MKLVFNRVFIFIIFFRHSFSTRLDKQPKPAYDNKTEMSSYLYIFVCGAITYVCRFQLKFVAAFDDRLGPCSGKSNVARLL
jgi:hypothetical protein